MREERGAATVEWTGLVLLVAAVLAGAGATAGALHAPSLVRSIRCAVLAGCHGEDRGLAVAYGDEVAGQVRAWAPGFAYEPGTLTLPVDFRRCRAHRCADAPDSRGEDVWRSTTGESRATVFTHVVDRRGQGGPLYLQYWLYYPDSNSAVAGSDLAWERSWILPRLRELVSGTPDYPGFHRDDWEGVFVRIDPDGSTWVRASAHGHYQSCKWRECRNEWIRPTGWVRVSRGSHAGHVPFQVTPRPHDPRHGPGVPRFITPPRLPAPHRPRVPQVPGRNLHERSTTGEALRLVPLETLDRDSYTPLDDDVRPPWEKRAYSDPETGDS
jgi:hypothetical protein